MKKEKDNRLDTNVVIIDGKYLDRENISKIFSHINKYKPKVVGCLYVFFQEKSGDSLLKKEIRGNYVLSVDLVTEKNKNYYRKSYFENPMYGITSVFFNKNSNNKNITTHLFLSENLYKDEDTIGNFLGKVLLRYNSKKFNAIMGNNIMEEIKLENPITNLKILNEKSVFKEYKFKDKIVLIGDVDKSNYKIYSDGTKVSKVVLIGNTLSQLIRW